MYSVGKSGKLHAITNKWMSWRTFNKCSVAVIKHYNKILLNSVQNYLCVNKTYMGDSQKVGTNLWHGPWNLKLSVES